MPELSVLIPSRNEMFLRRTVEDVLKNLRGDTEIIVVLDGVWANPGLDKHDRVTVIHRPISIGQRGATNEAARVSTAPYIMKLDAHCSVSEGFDIALIESAQELGPDVMHVPKQYNLHAFDWVCKTEECNWNLYQGPTPLHCPKCKGAVEKNVIWKRRESRLTTSWSFDKDLRFDYWGEWKDRPEIQAQMPYTDTMSMLGACWFVSQETYWKIGGLDEAHGSWGQMGTELACKMWLSERRLVCNHRAWFAHMFRTQGGDFSFPYKMSNRDQNKARAHSKNLWLKSLWPGAKRKLSWMLEHFGPNIKGWEKTTADRVDEGVPSIGAPEEPVVSVVGRRQSSVVGRRQSSVVYYSDCRGDKTILRVVQERLVQSTNGHQIVSSTLMPVDFGDVRIVLANRTRGILSMFKQILAGLELSDSETVFLCEHDVLYHPSHFDFVPPTRDAFYYNENVWKVRATDGQALFYRTKQTSGLCADRDLLVGHYRKRVAKVEQNARDLKEQGLPVRRDGYSRHMGFEPGCHAEPRGVDNYPAAGWMSASPNIDIRHEHNLTPSRWSQDEFRSKNSCLEWTMSDEVPGWGKTKDRFKEFLMEACQCR